MDQQASIGLRQKQIFLQGPTPSAYVRRQRGGGQHKGAVRQRKSLCFAQRTAVVEGIGLVRVDMVEPPIKVMDRLVLT
jgi:hypothetical protein